MISLSIRIPVTNEIERDYSAAPSGLLPLDHDASEWRSAIYEVWAAKERADKIYNDVMRTIFNVEKEVRLYQIEPLVFEKKRDLVLSGIRLLSSTGYIASHPEDWLQLQSLCSILAETVATREKGK